MRRLHMVAGGCVTSGLEQVALCVQLSGLLLGCPRSRRVLDLSAAAALTQLVCCRWSAERETSKCVECRVDTPVAPRVATTHARTSHPGCCPARLSPAARRGPGPGPPTATARDLSPSSAPRVPGARRVSHRRLSLSRSCELRRVAHPNHALRPTRR